MHKTTIYLDDAVYEQIRSRAEREGSTQAAIIRRALEEYTLGQEPRLPQSLGMGRGSSDLSTRSDELLSGFGADE